MHSSPQVLFNRYKHYPMLFYPGGTPYHFHGCEGRYIVRLERINGIVKEG